MAFVRVPSYDAECSLGTLGWWDTNLEQYFCLSPSQALLTGEQLYDAPHPQREEAPKPTIDVTLGLGVIPVWIWGLAGGLVVLWLLGLGRR